MEIKEYVIDDTQRDKILSLQEDHFNDLKAKEVKPAKLSKSISAFSNAVGGELYVGIGEVKLADGTETRAWNGFADIEDAGAVGQRDCSSNHECGTQQP